jgi:hypothetical protein
MHENKQICCYNSHEIKQVLWETEYQSKYRKMNYRTCLD